MRKSYITRLHLVLEILSYVLIAVSFIMAVVGIFTLSAEIPTHYDAAGNVDGYGPPAFLLVMPAIMLVCNLSLSLVVHLMNPALWNMPFKINPARKNLVYRDMVSMFMWMELEIAVFNLIFTIMCYTQEAGGMLALTGFLMAAFTVTIVACTVLAARHNK